MQCTNKSFRMLSLQNKLHILPLISASTSIFEFLKMGVRRGLTNNLCSQFCVHLLKIIVSPLLPPVFPGGAMIGIPSN